MNKTAIQLFGKVSFPLGEARTSPAMVTALNLEVAGYGYGLTASLMKALGTLGDTAFRTQRSDILNALSEIKGMNHDYKRLFNNFPYDTPDQHEYMEKRVLGDLASRLGITLGGNRLTALSCGHIIDSALFDVEEFGACPICQHAVPELSSPDEAKFAFASVTPAQPLDFSPDGLKTEGDRLLARQSSLSEDEKSLLKALIADGVPLSAPEKIYNETIPFVYRAMGVDAIRGSMKSATDVLRIVYFLSNPDADLSLKENVRFKLSTSEKKAVLSLLDGVDNLAEDMMRNRERWLRLGEGLHPNTPKNTARYPRAAEAFDRLRNRAGEIDTFSRRMEVGLRSRTVDAAFVADMASRPGEFARKIDFMLRTAADPEIVTTALRDKVAPKMTDKMLLEIRKYLGSRDLLKQRLFIPKGRVNRVQVVEDKRAPLPAGPTSDAIAIIDTELRSRFSAREPLGRVFIDPLLQDVVLPFNRRGDSSTSTATLPKGSRFPFVGDVIRLFVWWKNGDAGRVDVDLSLTQFDSSMKSRGYVGFQNLQSQGVVHSGDIQNAPDGAAEFIDIEVAKLVSAGVRFISPSVRSFTGQTFNRFPCFVGYMERDALRSGKVFEPESVTLRFDLDSENTTAAPIIFDLVERKVIYADIASGNSAHSAEGGAGTKQQALTEAMMTVSERKPTLYDVLLLNAQARGEIVDNREDADVVYDFSDALRLIEEATA